MASRRSRLARYDRADGSTAWPTLTAVACTALAVLLGVTASSAQSTPPAAPAGQRSATKSANQARTPQSAAPQAQPAQAAQAAQPARSAQSAARPAGAAAATANGTGAASPTGGPAANTPVTPAAPTTGPTTGPAAKQRPAPAPVPDDPNLLTDEKIGASINKAVNFLYKQFDPKTHMVSEDAGKAAKAADTAYQGGMDALCLYALMQGRMALEGKDAKDSPVDFKSPEFLAMVNALERVDLSNGSPQTYAHALRSTCLSLYVTTLHLPETPNAKPNADSAAFMAAVPVIQDDCVYGLYACDGGAYTYSHKLPDRNNKNIISGNKDEGPRNDKELMEFYNHLTPQNLPAPKKGWDNSNSQYGLLGVWSAVDAEIGIEVPLGYWGLVDKHWRDAQEKADGGWTYGAGEGRGTTLTMTCAGLASEFVCHEYLEPVGLNDKAGRIPFSPAIQKGLGWFEKGDNSINGAPGNGYALYGVERVGLACGFKFFGQHDWYRELATKIVASQQPNGSFPGGYGPTINTAYTLLFLARGRHPIVMNKLRFDSDGKGGPGYWLNRPRDAAGLARFVGKQLERPLNWQVINVDTDWTGWLDSPIMEIASNKPVTFTPEQITRLRNFVESGGMIYLQADGDSADFNKIVPGPKGLAHELFPQYELEDVKADNPLFSSESGVWKIPHRPGLKMVTNGSRILLLWSPHDVSKFWHVRDDKRHRPEFQFGANMFVYAAGKRDLRNRLDSPYVPPIAKAPLATIKVARLQYPSSAWDPEPGAWRRYANLFQKQTSYKLDVSTVDLASLKPGDAPLAVLTGTAKFGFSAAQVSAVKNYVEAGGVLLIDTTGGGGLGAGTGQFGQGVSAMLSQAFANVLPQGVGNNHPVIAGGTPGTSNLVQTQPQRFRQATKARGLAHGTGLQEIKAGKGRVIFTDLDITSGLLSTATGGILGYDPAFAEALVKNVILWSVDGQNEGAGVAASAGGAAKAPAEAREAESAAPAAPAAPSTPAAAPAAPRTAVPGASRSEAPRTPASPVGPRATMPVKPGP